MGKRYGIDNGTKEKEEKIKVVTLGTIPYNYGKTMVEEYVDGTKEYYRVLKVIDPWIGDLKVKRTNKLGRIFYRIFDDGKARFEKYFN